MPISKIHLPGSTATLDVRNGHGASITYANEQFSGSVTSVHTPYVGLNLNLYFPAELDIETGVKTVSLTFGDGNTYTLSFLIIGYSYDFPVTVSVQVVSITGSVLGYNMLQKGSIPSVASTINAEVNTQNRELILGASDIAQGTVVITYPAEDIDGTSYEVYSQGPTELPEVTSADEGKYLRVDNTGAWNTAKGDFLILRYVREWDSINDEPSDTITCTSPSSDLLEAFLGGSRPIVAALTESTSSSEYRTVLFPNVKFTLQGDTLTGIGTTAIVVDDDTMQYRTLTHTSTGSSQTITLTEGEFEGGGGSSEFIVNYTINNGNIVADKTFSEISAAYNAGSRIWATVPVSILYPGSNGQYLAALNALITSVAASYTICGIDADVVTVSTLVHGANNTIEIINETGHLLPTTDKSDTPSSDFGKVAVVDSNGDWKKAPTKDRIVTDEDAVLAIKSAIESWPIADAIGMLSDVDISSGSPVCKWVDVPLGAVEDDGAGHYIASKSNTAIFMLDHVTYSGGQPEFPIAITGRYRDRTVANIQVSPGEDPDTGQTILVVDTSDANINYGPWPFDQSATDLDEFYRGAVDISAFYAGTVLVGITALLVIIADGRNPVCIIGSITSPLSGIVKPFHYYATTFSEYCRAYFPHEPEGAAIQAYNGAAFYYYTNNPFDILLHEDQVVTTINNNSGNFEFRVNGETCTVGGTNALKVIDITAAAGDVESVNGQIGTVILDAEDVGALPNDTYIPQTASDVGALTDDTDIIVNGITYTPSIVPDPESDRTYYDLGTNIPAVENTITAYSGLPLQFQLSGVTITDIGYIEEEQEDPVSGGYISVNTGIYVNFPAEEEEDILDMMEDLGYASPLTDADGDILATDDEEIILG